MIALLLSKRSHHLPVSAEKCQLQHCCGNREVRTDVELPSMDDTEPDEDLESAQLSTKSASWKRPDFPAFLEEPTRQHRLPCYFCEFPVECPVRSGASSRQIVFQAYTKYVRAAHRVK